ncbi:MAG: hypothetical protein ACLUNW_11730 [Prevotella sp.]
MAKELKNLTKRSENYSQWFNDLVMKADLAEQSAVRGCMTIKPYGYAIWEKSKGFLLFHYRNNTNRDGDFGRQQQNSTKEYGKRT